MHLVQLQNSTTVGFPLSRATNHTPGRPKTSRFISWWTWCTLGLPNFARHRRLAHNFMNSQPNSKILPLLDSRSQGLQIALWTGQQPVSVCSYLHQFSIKFHIKGYISHSGSAWTGQQPVSSLVSAFGVHLVY